MSPLWRGPDVIHGFALGEKRKAIAQTPTVPTISSVRVTTLLYARITSLISRVAGGVARHSSWAIELLALCLNNNSERFFMVEKSIMARYIHFTIGESAIAQALVLGRE